MENFKATWKGFNRQKQKMTMKSEETSGRYIVTSFIVITLNLDFNSMCHKEETFPVPLKYVDVTRAAHTNPDVLQEKRIDDYIGMWTRIEVYQILGQVSQSSHY